MIQMDFESTYNGANDQIVLDGTGAVLTPSNAQIIIKSAGILDTTDYVLIDLTGSGASFSGSFNVSLGLAGVTLANSAEIPAVLGVLGLMWTLNGGELVLNRGAPIGAVG